MTTYIAIVGSRHYPRPDLVDAFVADLAADSTVISGGAPGVDSVAEEVARAHGLQTLIFHADRDNLAGKATIRSAWRVSSST